MDCRVRRRVQERQGGGGEDEEARLVGGLTPDPLLSPFISKQGGLDHSLRVDKLTRVRTEGRYDMPLELCSPNHRSHFLPPPSSPPSPHKAQAPTMVPPTTTATARQGDDDDEQRLQTLYYRAVFKKQKVRVRWTAFAMPSLPPSLPPSFLIPPPSGFQSYPFLISSNSKLCLSILLAFSSFLPSRPFPFPNTHRSPSSPAPTTKCSKPSTPLPPLPPSLPLPRP